MNIMILGHKDHGKTTVAELLRNKFGFSFEDTTQYVTAITEAYLVAHPECGDAATFNFKLYHDKDSVRHVMVKALTDYNQHDRARFVKEQFTRCNIYAGCRSEYEYQAALPIIDVTFWVRDIRKEENDPTMNIARTDNMILLKNDGTVFKLEATIKQALAKLGNIPITKYDRTYRDSILSELALKVRLEI